MKKKYCVITNNYFHLENFLIPLINSLSEEFEVTVILSKINKKNIKFSHHVKIINVNFQRNYNLFSHFYNLIKLIFILKKYKFDVLHTHTPIVSIIARLAALFSNINCIYYTCHGFYFTDQSSKLNIFIWSNIEKFLSYLTTRSFYVSEEDFKYSILNKFKTKRESLFIGNGVNINKFIYQSSDYKKKMRLKLNIQDDDFAIVYVGRIVEEKGILDLIRAIEIINLQNTKQITLFLIGKRLDDDHSKNITKEIIKSKKKGMKIVQYGYSNEIHSILHAFDLFCLPSWREGRPVSAIEAICSGIPVLLTDIRGSRELITHNYNGMLEKIKSPNALSISILKFMNNNKLSKFFVKNNKNLIYNFDEKKIIEIQLLKAKEDCKI